MFCHSFLQLWNLCFLLLDDAPQVFDAVMVGQLIFGHLKSASVRKSKKLKQPEFLSWRNLLILVNTFWTCFLLMCRKSLAQDKKTKDLLMFTWVGLPLQIKSTALVFGRSLPGLHCVHLPTSLLAVDRPLGVVLTVLEVWLQLIQPQCGCTTKTSVVTADLKLRQHVAHDAGHRPEVC